MVVANRSGRGLEWRVVTATTILADCAGISACKPGRAG